MRPIKEVLRLKQELGRNPTLAEIRNNIPPPYLKLLQAEYGSYSAVLDALNDKTIDQQANEARMHRKYRALCSKKEQIQGFFRHTIDLKDLFERHGNPKSLKLIAQPDTHAKFVNMPAFKAFVKFMDWYRPHIHLIMGDFADCEGIAHWEPDSMEPRRLVPELKISRSLLSECANATDPNTTRIFLEGNHEYWIQMFMNQHPEFFDGMEDLGIELNLKTLLGLDKHGFEVFPLNHLVKIGKAHFTHGLYTVQHHAKKHLDVFKCNIYYGHLHDTQESNQTSIDGHMEAASLGCLCRLDAKFLKGKPNNWVNAFGIFEFFPDGTYTKLKPTIIDGRFSFAGMVFNGN